MVNKFALSLLVSSLMFANVAMAERNYMGLNGLLLDYSEEDLNDDASLSGVSIRLGRQINENFSGELRVGVGLSDDDLAINGVDVTMELETLLGAYFRGGIAVADVFFPYLVFGATRTELEGSGANATNFVEISDAQVDFSYGAGFDVFVTESFALNVEYMNYYDENDVSLQGASAGVVFRF